MAGNKTVKDTLKQSRLQSQSKALDNLQALLRLVKSADFKLGMLPYLRLLLIKEWPDPSQYDSRDKFYDVYCQMRAEVEVSKKVLGHLSEEGLKAQIKNLQQMMAQKGRNYET